jgi:hypothetical protein
LGSRLVAAGAAWDLFDHLASRSKKFARNERLRHDRQYGVAGIRESWRNQNGAWERTFCIITVPTDELAGVVQDRMPAIIPIAQRPVGSPNNFCGGRRLLFFVVLFDLTQADSNPNQE